MNKVRHNIYISKELKKLLEDEIVEIYRKTGKLKRLGTLIREKLEELYGIKGD